MNRKSKTLALILIFGLTITSAGCSILQATPVCQMPLLPTRPEIAVYRTGDMVQMTLEDLAELNIYIIELERGYER